jgi:hypothetical protein
VRLAAQALVYIVDIGVWEPGINIGWPFLHLDPESTMFNSDDGVDETLNTELWNMHSITSESVCRV